MKKMVLFIAILFTGLCQLQANCCSNYCYPACCGEWVVGIDYLFWRADQSGMTYAVGGENPNIVIGESIGNTRNFQQESDWHSGFRLGVGYDLPCSWGLNFSWTRFHNRAKSHDNAPVIIATELLDIQGDFFFGGTTFGGTTNSCWNLNFDMLDLDIGTCLYANCRFSFSPYLGLKGGWIYQNQKIFYNNFVGNFGSPNQFFINSTVNEINRFSGAGPKVGFYSEYNFFKCFSLISNFSTALLYGFSHNPTTTFIDNLTEEVVETNSRFDFHQRQIVPTVQMLIGLQWDRCFCSCYEVSLALAYELQYFWNTWRNQNSTTQTIFITDAGYGDLMFQGITAELALQF